MGNEDATVSAVSLKLPTFWPQTLETWFAQAEAQFAVHNITKDDTKYYYTVAALDQETANRVTNIIMKPPHTDMYKTLKDRLLDTFGMSENERSTLLHLPPLGDEKPSALMDRMLSILGSDHEPCLFFRQIFLERLPEHVRAVLVHFKEKDCQQLAKAADGLYEATQLQTVQQVSKQNTVKSNKKKDSKGEKAPRHKYFAIFTTNLGIKLITATHSVPGKQKTDQSVPSKVPRDRPDQQFVLRQRLTKNNKHFLVDTGAEISVVPATSIDKQLKTESPPPPNSC